jgi:hypothetical protein
MRPHPNRPAGFSREAIFMQWVFDSITALQRGNLPGFLTLRRTRPRRPVGTSAEAILMQWFYDTLISLQPQETRGVLISRTTRGVIHRAHRMRAQIQQSTSPSNCLKDQRQWRLSFTQTLRIGFWLHLQRVYRRSLWRPHSIKTSSTCRFSRSKLIPPARLRLTLTRL